MATVRAWIYATQPIGDVIQLHGWGDNRGAGHVPSVQPVAERYQPTGGVGTGRQQIGWAGRAATVPIAVWCYDETEALDVIARLERLTSYTVDVDRGDLVRLRVTVDEVHVHARRVKGPPIGGGLLAAWRVEGTLTVERQPDA